MEFTLLDNGAMRRPFLKKLRNCWYVHHAGKQVNLGPDRDAAFAKWRDMQAPSNEHRASTMVQKFLDRPRKDSTQRFYKSHLNLFTRHIGTLRVCDLRAFYLTELLDKYDGNYRHNIARCVKCCFKWLEDNEHIASSPFKRVPTPPAASRSDEAYIEPERWRAIIGSVIDDDLRDILIFLKETGCRPQEARRLEARHLKDDVAVFPKEESKGGRVRRVIHLTDRSMVICHRLALKHPAGPLFRNQGKPWTNKALCNACHPLGFTPYWLRHSFVTDAIVNGIDLVTLSVLLGHSGVGTLSRVYQHVQRCAPHLQTAVKNACR